MSHTTLLLSSSVIGVIGNVNWFISQNTIKMDPSLSSYHGIQGENARRKLAETFKRPTTWKDYCALVSENNCDGDDGVAARAPAADGSEDDKYFVDGVYTGFFRATERNDCDANPTNCTGHFVDFPCGWVSYFRQQAHHLGIALESQYEETGEMYTYDNLVQIWLAANRTKSHIGERT